MSRSEVPPPPGIWSLPAWTGRNLAARDALLGDIAAALAKRGVAPLCGLGGAGKSKLAIEYAHRNKAAYDVVFLVRAESNAAMDADLALLASELRLPEQDRTDAARAIAAVKLRLGRRGRWLLIFDGARDPREVEARLPGVTHGGHVIITSRNPIWRGLATVGVRGIDRAESVRFLLQRTGEADAEAADALAEELGDLALALAQAGAYIEETGRPLAEYLALFSRRPMELLKRPLSFPITVANVWDSDLTEVFSNPPARELLGVCACLRMVEIPRRALSDFDPLALDDAIATLRRHALIEVKPRALSVHRLVRLVVWSTLHRDQRRHWTEIANQIHQNSLRLTSTGWDDREGRTQPEPE